MFTFGHGSGNWASVTVKLVVNRKKITWQFIYIYPLNVPHFVWWLRQSGLFLGVSASQLSRSLTTWTYAAVCLVLIMDCTIEMCLSNKLSWSIFGAGQLSKMQCLIVWPCDTSRLWTWWREKGLRPRLSKSSRFPQIYKKVTLPGVTTFFISFSNHCLVTPVQRWRHNIMYFYNNDICQVTRQEGLTRQTI